VSTIDPAPVYTTIADALSLFVAWREEGLTLAFTNGCFDLLHPGHVATICFASQQAHRLVVGVNSDRSLASLKDRRPLISDKARAGMIASLRFVDAVLLFDDESVRDTVAAIQPDVLVKGGDYKRREEVVGHDLVERVEIAPVVDGVSTTQLISRIQGK